MRIQKIIICAIVAACFSAGACAFAAASTSVKQYEFTWTFDKPVQTGQFVNGDWWVVPPAGQDSVTVVSVDPAPVKSPDGKLMNGSMVNPMPGFQAFDERAYLWKGECGATYPLKLQVNQSLASAVAETDDNEDGKKRISAHYYVKGVAVLTCLGKPPLPTDFRPPYVGNDKPLYDSAKMRRDLLPNLPLPASVKAADLSSPKDLADVWFSRPWVDFLQIWCGFQSRGRHEIGYGREKASMVGGAGLYLCLDSKVVGDKEPLLIDLVQTGIDLYGTVSSGGHWISDGGWQQGRKFPILFAGLMLDDKGMLNIGQKYPPTTNTFQEDTAAFIVTKADVGRQLACMVSGPAKTATANTIGLSGVGFPNGTAMTGNWIKIVNGPGAGQVRLIANSDTGWPRTNKVIVTCVVDPPWDVVPEVEKSVYQVLGYQEKDIGHGKYGGNHWRSAESAINDNPSFQQPYSQANKSSWSAEVLAARILGLKAAWNQDAVFQVIDDYVAETAPGAPFANKTGGCPRFWPAGQGPKAVINQQFISEMWNTYRSKYGDAPKEDAKK